MHEAITPLRQSFLQWIAEHPRTYREAMDAWRTTCPRMTIWEDAILEGLIRVQPGPTRDESRVELTAAGRALIDE